MFAGFKSRWMMPCSCAASSASAICRAIGSASSIGIAPRAIRCDKILAFDEFHHEARAVPADLFESVDRGDVRMIQRRERLRFALETRQAIGIVGERVRQNLDRDLASQLRVARAIHLAHAAGTEYRDDLIRAEARAEGQGHGGAVEYTGWESRPGVPAKRAIGEYS